MKSIDLPHRAILESIAHRAMLERGLFPDFSSEVLAELDRLHVPVSANNEGICDLRDLLWSSIDNDDSLDLDQLTVAEILNGERTRVLVAVADVDALVNIGSAIDGHASHNTSSVYTAAMIFPMLPEKLSTNLTSLNFGEDRLSIIVDMTIGADGSLQGSDLYRGLVCNHAKLAYNSVAAWLDGNGMMPEGVARVKGLDENLLMQNKFAQKMKAHRHANGALSLQTIEAKPVFQNGIIRSLEVEEKNSAKDIVEDFMIAANSATARYLSDNKFPSIRRVVHTPKRWDRIQEIASEHGTRIPDEPDSKALEAFLVKEKAADPLRFPDLSLAVIKLLGAGEYAAELPGAASDGHFGLAVRDYAHSTAPNRRYTDLITQRLVKAALTRNGSPYSIEILKNLAQHCTMMEDNVNKVERQVGKSAAALLIESRTGERFDAIVTGSAAKGTWVRLLKLPVEGRLELGFGRVDVGDRLKVQLVSTDVERGYIDFRM